jgi:hypothetical protein
MGVNYFSAVEALIPLSQDSLLPERVLAKPLLL